MAHKITSSSNSLPSLKALKERHFHEMEDAYLLTIASIEAQKLTFRNNIAMLQQELEQIQARLNARRSLHLLPQPPIQRPELTCRVNSFALELDLTR